jgi:molybdenum cofactor cytidylyltransferase
LILGASAIVDLGDIVPAAVREAGGTIRHLGMPVDPGNLLLLAAHGDTPVVGVPGCARSLKPSGFDWVLARIAADLPIGGEDLAAMGTGGLLKEMPTRPQPREREKPPPPQAIAAIVLAAGESKRMPGANKLLCEVHGEPMLAHVVDVLAGAGLAQIVVVTGHEATEIRGALSGRDVVFTHNPDYRGGMSSSLRVGLEAVEGKVDAALVCLGDMPWVGVEVIAALLAAFDRDDPRVCVPVHDRKRGNPVLWPARFFIEMRQIAGDQGARRLLDQYAEEVIFVPVSDPSVNLDIDTPEALEALRQRGETPR